MKIEVANLYSINALTGDMVTVRRDGEIAQVDPHHLQVGDELQITKIDPERCVLGGLARSNGSDR